MSDSMQTTERSALQRTHLANERTLLAYVRTALALLALAIFILKFGGQPSEVPLAIVSALMAFGLLLFGVTHFRHVRRMIDGGDRIATHDAR